MQTKLRLLWLILLIIVHIAVQVVLMLLAPHFVLLTGLCLLAVVLLRILAHFCNIMAVQEMNRLPSRMQVT